MPIINGYTDLNTLQARLGIPDDVDNATLERVIITASRWIDGYCERRFYAVSETRYYTAEFPDWLDIDDLVNLESLATDTGDRTYTSLWAINDYDLEPANASLNNKPYTSIRVAPQAIRCFPVNLRRGVRVTGDFGYSATTPTLVTEACLLQAARLFNRKEAVFGVSGPAKMGQQQIAINVGGSATVRPQLDPDVKLLLEPLMRSEFDIRGV